MKNGLNVSLGLHLCLICPQKLNVSICAIFYFFVCIFLKEAKVFASLRRFVSFRASSSN